MIYFKYPLRLLNLILLFTDVSVSEYVTNPVNRDEWIVKFGCIKEDCVLKSANRYLKRELNVKTSFFKATDFYYSSHVKVYHLYLRTTTNPRVLDNTIHINLSKNGTALSYYISIESKFKGIESLISSFFMPSTQIENYENETDRTESERTPAEYLVFPIESKIRSEIRYYPEINPDFYLYKQKIVEEPVKSYVSPLGWHSPEVGKPYNLSGNNVIVEYYDFHENMSEYDPNIYESNSDNKFNLVVNEGPDNKLENLNAAMINSFYYINMLHDVLYQFGFNEVAGNFQGNNFGKGGKKGDPMIVKFKNFNNLGKTRAYYSHTLDGISPSITLAISAEPRYQQLYGLDDSIIIHEYTHGLVNRLLGGPNSNCLFEEEANTLNEGWANIVSILFRIPKNPLKNMTMNVGTYIYPNGIFNPPFTVNRSINDAKYSGFKHYNHKKSNQFIWTSILYDILWVLIDDLPLFNEWTNQKIPIKNHANTLFLQIIIDSIKLAPCNPTIIQGRDAFLHALELNAGNKYKCKVWEKFASRGLGLNAKTPFNGNYIDNFELPSNC